MDKKRIVLAGSCRTPIGKMGGQMSSLSAAEMGTIVIKEALKRSGVPAEEVDQVYMGCVLQAAQGQNVARQASMHAGIPYTTPALTLNIVCGSGLEAVNEAARLVQYGDADIVVAGGTESMSRAPYALTKGRYGYRMGNATMVDCMVNDGLWDVFGDYHMGITAENVADKYGLTREQLDEFSAKSQNKAEDAQKSGRFDEEIVPVDIKGRKGKVTHVDKDEGIRYGQTPDQIAGMRPAFKEGGKVTAANSSGINDAAAAVVVMSAEAAKKLNVTPEVEWLGSSLAGVPPEIMGIGPIAATQKLEKKLDFDARDVDLVEANEAFATQSVAVIQELGLDPEKVNVNGGAIALGHPVGASGCRILVTLIHAMKWKKAKTGLATLCIGGGMGCATLVKAWEE